MNCDSSFVMISRAALNSFPILALLYSRARFDWEDGLMPPRFDISPTTMGLKTAQPSKFLCASRHPVSSDIISVDQ